MAISSVGSRETSRKGHEYHIQHSLGKFSNLKPENLMTDLKRGKVFPLVILKGDLASVGNKAMLRIPILSSFRCALLENKVEVISQTDTAIRLKACAKHIFRGGTVEMRIERVEDELVYFIDGYGHEKETFFRYHLNLLFVHLGLWQLCIKKNVIPYAKQQEALFSKL